MNSLNKLIFMLSATLFFCNPSSAMDEERTFLSGGITATLKEHQAIADQRRQNREEAIQNLKKVATVYSSASEEGKKAIEEYKKVCKENPFH